jgi:lipopolysaccharide/colanic/teichoic acid biosynthesis glycosyltransferase
MYSGSDRIGRLTVGSNDKRITKIGKFLRRYKLDEFPQLLNVFLGDMSLVGPRPEVTEFIDTYTDEERSIILSVRPGITDNASVSFINENEFLSSFKDPLEAYITEVLPKKKRLQINYVNTQSCAGDFLIIFKTFLKIIK